MRKKHSILEKASDFIANFKSRNVQMGTDASIEGMDLLRWKAERVQNVGFDQSKGNLFEYIESAKLQRNMGNKAGIRFDKTPLTDVGRHKGGWGERIQPRMTFALLIMGKCRVWVRQNIIMTRTGRH